MREAVAQMLSKYDCQRVEDTTRALREILTESIGRLDVDQARSEVLPFVRNPEALAVWSREFFLDVVRRIRCV